MYALHASDGPVFIECPDRRHGDRLEQRRPVRIDGQDARTLDISRTGLAAVLAGSLHVEDVVRVTLPARFAADHDVTVSARVARVEPQVGGCVVGLEFLG